MTNEEAIEKLREISNDFWDDDGYGGVTRSYTDGITAIDLAIEALQERKTGRWITDKKSVYCGAFLERECHCSECGLRRDFIGWKFDNYCSCCGAKMEGYE